MDLASCSSTQESQAGERPPQQVQQKPTVVFSKVLQQLRQQQQGRPDVESMPAPVHPLVSSALAREGCIEAKLK